jgi:molecular chaperone IbpA
LTGRAARLNQKRAVAVIGADAAVPGRTVPIWLLRKGELAMNAFDLSPLFRSTVGFDHLDRVLEAAARIDEAALSYPPYNIEKLGEERYRITMAVAGFSEGDLDLTAKGNSLVISGKVRKDEAQPQYLYRGIAGRSFERRFELADHIRVDQASLVNGLLHVDLVREIPEAMKPRSIAITTTPDLAAPAPRIVDSQAA